jgi:hypothetical protein
MAGAKLKFDFEKPASADRVLRLAKRIKALIEAAGIGSDADDITVSIMNLRLNSVITGRTERGIEAIERTSSLLKAAAVTKGPINRTGDAALAAACAGIVDEFVDDPPLVLLPGKRKPLKLTREDAARLRQIQAPAPQPHIRYTSTTVISPVLRYGATEEGGRISVRLSINGSNVDVPVAESAIDSFIDTLKKRDSQFRIAVSLAFRHGADGPQLVTSESRALRVLKELIPTTGFQFLSHAKQVVRFDEEHDA